MRTNLSLLGLYAVLLPSSGAGLPAVSAAVSAAQETKSEGTTFPIDFSFAGYGGGGVAIPRVEAVLLVRPSGGDDTELLQAAIDSIGRLLPDENGFRGALQLSGGQFRVSGQLHLDRSGMVLRGNSEGQKTVVLATGMDRRTLIEIRPNEASRLSGPVLIVDRLVPAGGRVLTLESSNDFAVGDRIVITRPSTKEWIADIGMDKREGTFVDRRGLRWPVGSRDLVWDRILTSVDRATHRVTIDAPITTALEAVYGGGTVRRVVKESTLHQIGIENLELESEFDSANRRDEEHAWMAIAVNHAEDGWIANVVARHFVSSLVHVGARGRRISIFNCRSEQPVSEAAGFRRQSFWIEGQQVLVRDCTADSGMNDFAVGLCAGGPNVFLKNEATHALGASGASESWSSGTLYEEVSIEGAGLRLTYDFERAQAGGWTAVNSVVWNSRADEVTVVGPFSAPNQTAHAPSSLYFDQLEKRLGPDANVEEYRAPPVLPRYAVSPELRELKPSDVPTKLAKPEPSLHPVEIVNGRFVRDGKLLWGGTAGDPYWKGQTSPNRDGGSSITRFVPGKVGEGLTEDLPDLTRRLVASGNSFYESVTGLWYDRRRDDHAIAKRTNRDVWAPFFEMPWARSGQGEAWDGLSQYDLTKYNPWYFGRLEEFADSFDKNGLLLYFNFYNTHNLLEYFTHWVDYPFRPANNVNETGLEEPPPKEPWARMHMGNQFYDPSNPELRELHRAYIFHALDVLGSAKNVVFKLGIQYAGPLSFQRFFIETVHEWEVRNHTDVRLGLTASKDVTDSILADPELASQVDVIDLRYWQYRTEASFSNGDELWAPPGGTNRSFREMVGDAFILESDIPFPTTEEKLYQQVREYRDRFPDKAIVSASNDVSPIASLMAGGAQVLGRYEQESRPEHTTFYSFVRRYLSDVLMRMDPNDRLLEEPGENWCLTDSENRNVLIYSVKGTHFAFSTGVPGKVYSGTWFDPLTERVVPFEGDLAITEGAKIQKPTSYNWLLLLRQE